MTQLNADVSGGVQGNSDGAGLDGQSQIAPTNVYDPETHVLVERFKLENVGGDINNAIHNAKVQGEWEQKGYGLLDTQLEQMNLTPVQLLNYLQNPEDPPPADYQQAAPDIQQQQDTQQPNFDQYAFLQQIDQRMETKFTQFNQQQQTSQAQVAETNNMNKAIADLGFGALEQGSFERADLQGRLETRIMHTRRGQAIAGDPQGDAKLNRAFTQAEIKAAAGELAPSLVAEKAARDEALSDSQDGLPQASLGDGPGGSAQKSLKDKSPAEQRETLIKAYKQRHGQSG